MKFKVISYLSHVDSHKVITEDGNTMIADLLTNADFPDDTDPKSLIGKEFTYEYTHPYITFFCGVKEIES